MAGDEPSIPGGRTPMAPVSWGELIDKITILEIKRQKIPGKDAQVSIAKELALLLAIAAPLLDAKPDIAALMVQLRVLNENLWDIEDAIRDKEAANRFDDEFIALARAVYKTNDRRGALKRQINVALGSGLREEKSYKPYPAEPGKDAV